MSSASPGLSIWAWACSKLLCWHIQSKSAARLGTEPTSPDSQSPDINTKQCSVLLPCKSHESTQWLFCVLGIIPAENWCPKTKINFGRMMDKFSTSLTASAPLESPKTKEFHPAWIRVETYTENNFVSIFEMSNSRMKMGTVFYQWFHCVFQRMPYCGKSWTRKWEEVVAFCGKDNAHQGSYHLFTCLHFDKATLACLILGTSCFGERGWVLPSITLTILLLGALWQDIHSSCRLYWYTITTSEFRRILIIRSLKNWRGKTPLNGLTYSSTAHRTEEVQKKN